jgi:hypothetical protein
MYFPVSLYSQAHLLAVSPQIVCDQEDFYRAEKALNRAIRARSVAEDHREQLLGQEVRQRAVQSVDTEHDIHQQNTAFSHHRCEREIHFREAGQG